VALFTLPFGQMSPRLFKCQSVRTYSHLQRTCSHHPRESLLLAHKPTSFQAHMTMLHNAIHPSAAVSAAWQRRRTRERAGEGVPSPTTHCACG
jgi:hypothetical protein